MYIILYFLLLLNQIYSIFLIRRLTLNFSILFYIEIYSYKFSNYYPLFFIFNYGLFIIICVFHSQFSFLLHEHSLSYPTEISGSPTLTYFLSFTSVSLFIIILSPFQLHYNLRFLSFLFKLPHFTSQIIISFFLAYSHFC